MRSKSVFLAAMHAAARAARNEPKKSSCLVLLLGIPTGFLFIAYGLWTGVAT